MSYGEFRSAMAEPDYVRAYQAIQNLENDEKAYAINVFWKTIDPNLLAEKVEWSNSETKETQKSLWFIEEEEWEVSIGGVTLASNETLDLKPIQRKWAVIPAWHVLPIWEEWAAKNAPEHLEAPRKALEMAERGEHDQSIAGAAYTAADAADAVYAASAAAHTAHAAYAAADAHNAAAKNQNLVENITYEQWCLKFTAHVLSILKDQHV